MNGKRNVLLVTLGAVALGGSALLANEELANRVSLEKLDAGYTLLAEGKCGSEGKCGGEGECGSKDGKEGNCGA